MDGLPARGRIVWKSVHQVIYRSKAAQLLTEDEVARLVARARVYNEAHAITGVLLHSGPHFVQVLEGNQASVERLFRRVSHDSRHAGVSLLFNEAVPARQFPTWSMGYTHTCPTALTRLAAYLDPQHRAALVPSTYPAHAVISDLLDDFLHA